MTKKSKQKKAVRKPSSVKRIARQSSLPGMDDNKITAIETAALEKVKVRVRGEEADDDTPDTNESAAEESMAVAV